MHTSSWLFGLTALLFTASASAEHMHGGPAFDPTQKPAAMGAEWEAKPLRYEPWAEGAALAVTLDQHLFPALQPLIDEFSRQEGVRIAVQEGTCGISSGKLEKKAVDIGGFCCPAGAADRLPGLRFHTLGVAALALLVRRDNPVQSITLDQARQLFAGDILRWDALPEAAAFHEPVRPIGRLHCKARPGHWRLLLDNEDQFGPGMEEVSTIPDMIQAVSSVRGAVGYEVLYMAQRFAKEGGVRSLAIDGVAPETDQQLVCGRYPLYRTYNITTWEGTAANPLAERLVAFLQANAGRIDPQYGLIPVGRLREAGWPFEGDELVGDLQQAVRLDDEPVGHAQPPAIRQGLCGDAK